MLSLASVRKKLPQDPLPGTLSSFSGAVDKGSLLGRLVAMLLLRKLLEGSVVEVLVAFPSSS